MMKEKELYKICDTMEEATADLTEGYYPTVQELIDHKVEDNPEKFAAFIAFYASDPFSRMNLPEADEEAYKESVRYCKKMLYRISEKIAK